MTSSQQSRAQPATQQPDANNPDTTTPVTADGDTTARVSTPGTVQENIVECTPNEKEDAPPPRVIPTITQDEVSHNTTLAQNTQSQRTITQETMLHMINIQDKPFTAKLAASRQFPKEALAAVLNKETGKLMEYRHLIANPKYQQIWSNAYGKELGRLTQGIPGIVDGTNTISFIDKSNIPADRWQDVTYGHIISSYRPEKADPNRIRLTVGGNRINYPGDCGTPTADMLTVKLLLNSTVSTNGA